MMQAPFAVETEEQSSTKARALPADEKKAHQGEKESRAFTNKKDQNSKKNEKIEKYHNNGKTDQRKEKKEAATTRTEKKKKRERTGKDDKSHKINQKDINQEDVEDVKEEVEISMGARLPKRKRTNLYSSLSPAVIQATAKARAEAFAAASPSPQLASKLNKRKQSSEKKDNHPVKKGYSNHHASKESISNNSAAHLAAADAGGKIPREFIGHDGNVFYCRICLGLGEVVCCDGCPHVFHPQCLPVGPSKTSLENDDDPWYCHECVDAGRTCPRTTVTATTPTKKRRKAKERCSVCNRKETKSHPCVPCSGRNCDRYFHLVCPLDDAEVGLQNNDVLSSEQRLLCTSCEAAKVKSKKNGIQFEYDQSKLEEISRAQGKVASPSGGRGGERCSYGGRQSRGQGDRAGLSLRRTSSWEERMNRFKGLAEPPQTNDNSLRGKKRVYPSGFQSPFAEEEEDDNGVGPHSLAYVEKPLSSTPAFFFFLLHNRSVIEKSLYRRSPFFRGMERGPARNEKVAQEGAVIWIEMTPKERNEWVEVSMKDFEQRAVAWKEKEVIEAMIKTTDDQEKKGEREGNASKVSKLPPEDELHNARVCARMNQHNKVKCLPTLVSDKESSNAVLFELLNDMRFHPLPLVDANRTNEDLVLSNEKMHVAVQQFLVHGPIESSLGDSCMGCTRGWSHYCSVLKRPVPGSEHRAKLQPPVSSLTATRIGLGLKVNIPCKRDDQALDQGVFGQGVHVAKLLQGMSAGKQSRQSMIELPNYQSRDGSFLSGPSLRLDDATVFIESTVAISEQIEWDIDVSGIARPHSIIEAENSFLGKSNMLSRGLLQLRGLKKKMPLKNMCDRPDARYESDSSSSVPPSNMQRESKLRYQCGNCGTMLSSPLGCIPCRKSHLVTQVAKRNLCSPNSVAGEFLKRSSSVSCPNHGDGYNKVQCVMLGRSNLNDNSVSGRTKHADRGLDKIGLSLTMPWWSPNAILPPNPKRFPTPKPDSQISEGTSQTEHGRSKNSSTSESSSLGNGHNLNDDMPLERVKYSHDKRSKRDNIGRIRSHSLKAGKVELSLKHREDAKRELSYTTPDFTRRLRHIACCGILVGMIRRDPMRLFAEPVPLNNIDYHQVIHDPIDFCVIRKRVLSSNYSSLGSFIGDARKLCINACIFNAADSLYANTAQNIYDYLEVAHDRAKRMISILKKAHESSNTTNDDKSGKGDLLKDIEIMWSGAVELLEDSAWLKKQAQSDFLRTRENEIAYYGTLAIQRAAAAAKASLGGVNQPVVRRSHVQDARLRKRVDDEVSLHVGPIQLKDEPHWRNLQLLKLLKLVQKLRLEGRMLSESGCARCDGIKTDNETSSTVSLLRSKFKKMEDATKPRIAVSRLYQSTGLASKSNSDAREGKEPTAKKSAKTDSYLDVIDQASTDRMVSVRGSLIHGWGLFADQNFKAGEIVAEYVGEYVSNAVANLRERRYHKNHYRVQDYQFRVNETLVSYVMFYFDQHLVSATHTRPMIFY